MKKIIFDQEFSWNITKLLAEAYYCHCNNVPYETVSSPNMRPFLWFSKNHNERQVDTKLWFSGKELYYGDINTYPKNDKIYPDLKSHFLHHANTDHLISKINKDKPFLVINNKYISEWNGPPSIYIDTDTVLQLYDMLSPYYTCIYIRATQQEGGYDTDPAQAQPYAFDDYKRLKNRCNDMIFLNDFSGHQYNYWQACLMSLADKHISVAGGNACFSAYFAKELLIKNSTHPKTINRQIWYENSWLKIINNSTIFGTTSNEQLLTKAQEWAGDNS